jgi:hypothetical protein
LRSRPPEASAVEVETPLAGVIAELAQSENHAIESVFDPLRIPSISEAAVRAARRVFGRDPVFGGGGGVTRTPTKTRS